LEQPFQRQTQLNRRSEKRSGRPRGTENQFIRGSNHTSSEPRCFSAALYSGSWSCDIVGGVGLGIPPTYDKHSLCESITLVMQQSPICIAATIFFWINQSA